MSKVSDYKKQQARKVSLIIILLAAVILLCFYSAFLGTTDIKLSGIIARIFPSFGKSIGAEPTPKTPWIIFTSLRLPRAIAALIVGAVLGMCGTIMQATTGNVMASPFTTGISSAAGLGAAIGILFHPFGSQDTSTIICAFLLAALNAAIVYGVTAVAELGAGGMILIGVALNFLFGSANSLIQYVASEDQLSQIVHWTFGSLTGITWMQILVMAVTGLAAFFVFMRLGWSLNIMISGGDENAKALGVNPTKTRVIGGLFVTLAAAVTISFVGVIGFVGIVAPHISRMLIGSQQRILIPSSALIGSVLVLVADTLGRLVIAPAIIPVGVVLSVVGSPIFIYLILSQKKRRRS